jgi:hypothetical protein
VHEQDLFGFEIGRSQRFLDSLGFRRLRAVDASARTWIIVM